MWPRCDTALNADQVHLTCTARESCTWTSPPAAAPCDAALPLLQNWGCWGAQSSTDVPFSPRREGEREEAMTTEWMETRTRPSKFPQPHPPHTGRGSSPPPSPTWLSLDWISLAQRHNHRLPGAHAPPALLLLTGSVVSRRLSRTQDPGQRRTDRGFGALITPPPNVPHPEKTLDSREAEPNPWILDAVAVFGLWFVSGGVGYHKTPKRASMDLLFRVDAPVPPPSVTPPPPDPHFIPLTTTMMSSADLRCPDFLKDATASHAWVKRTEAHFRKMWWRWKVAEYEINDWHLLSWFQNENDARVRIRTPFMQWPFVHPYRQTT